MMRTKSSTFNLRSKCLKKTSTSRSAGVRRSTCNHIMRFISWVEHLENVVFHGRFGSRHNKEITRQRDRK